MINTGEECSDACVLSVMHVLLYTTLVAPVSVLWLSKTGCFVAVQNVIKTELAGLGLTTANEVISAASLFFFKFSQILLDSLHKFNNEACLQIRVAVKPYSCTVIY